MNNEIQIASSRTNADRLQKIYGNPDIKAIYGAGCINNPKVLFMFMNPTARNISSSPSWEGLRAPWIGTKNVWRLFHSLDLIDTQSYDNIQNGSSDIWTEDFAFNLYKELSDKSIYVTNLAKCTQDDARPLKNGIFREYFNDTLEEIYRVNPDKIVSFGNQVSSILLSKNIKVSDYESGEKESLTIKDKVFEVYPTYYPVGQGMRNIGKAEKRVKKIL